MTLKINQQLPRCIRIDFFVNTMYCLFALAVSMQCIVVYADIIQDANSAPTYQGYTKSGPCESCLSGDSRTITGSAAECIAECTKVGCQVVTVYLNDGFCILTQQDCGGGKPAWAPCNESYVSYTNNNPKASVTPAPAAPPALTCSNGGTPCGNPTPICNSNGTCEACTSDAQCPSGQICENGSCRDPHCTSNTQCSNPPTTPICENGRCRACHTDSECPANQKCNTNTGSCEAKKLTLCP